MPSHRTGLGLFSIALAAACAAPAAASAATVGTAAGGGNSTVDVHGRPRRGQRAHARAHRRDQRLRVHRRGRHDRRQPASCVAQGGSVVCPRPFATATRVVEIDLRNGDDTADLTSPSQHDHPHRSSATAPTP